MLNLLAENIGENVLLALGVFWKGMLAIAVVIALIIAVTAIMNAVDSKVQKKKAAKKSEEENTNTPDGEK